MHCSYMSFLCRFHKWWETRPLLDAYGWYGVAEASQMITSGRFSQQIRDTPWSFPSVTWSYQLLLIKGPMLTNKVSRFNPNVHHGRQYTNRCHQFLKPTNCSGAGSSNSTRFFSPMVGQLRAHSLHPDYLPHSTPTPSPHSTSPTPPPINRGAQGDSAQGLHTAGRPVLMTWSSPNTCRWAQHGFSMHLCLYGPLALWGLCAHLYENSVKTFLHPGVDCGT